MAKIMIEDKAKVKAGHLNDYLANERTFLAWVRTSIGIMAFGFVVEKFGLFVKELSYILSQNSTDIAPPSFNSPFLNSPILGIALIGFGLLMILLAFINYRAVEKQIREERFQHSLVLTIILTSAIVLIGIFLMIYLIRSA